MLLKLMRLARLSSSRCQDREPPKVCLDEARCLWSLSYSALLSAGTGASIYSSTEFHLGDDVVPPLTVSTCPNPMIPAGRNPGVKIGLLIGVGQEPSPKGYPCFVSVRSIYDLVSLFFRVGDGLGDRRFLPIKLEAGRIPHPFRKPNVQLLPLRLRFRPKLVVVPEGQTCPPPLVP